MTDYLCIDLPRDSMPHTHTHTHPVHPGTADHSLQFVCIPMHTNYMTKRRRVDEGRRGIVFHPPDDHT